MSGSSANFFVNAGLDLIPTDKVISDLLELSTTPFYSVEIKQANEIWPGGITLEEISFLAYEAVLPGTSLELGQVFGDRQGLTEQFPIKKVYPPIDVSFYIKSDYKIVTFFEKWMSLITPLNGSIDSPTSYFTFNYPDKYEKLISIVKYEKDARPYGSRLDVRPSTGPTSNPSSVTYTLLNAYPTNIISIPVSYDQSTVLKTTVTFNYDRYAFQANVRNRFGSRNATTNENDLNASITPSAPGPQTNPGGGPTLNQLNRQVGLVNEFVPTPNLGGIPNNFS